MSAATLVAEGGGQFRIEGDLNLATASQLIQAGDRLFEGDPRLVQVDLAAVGQTNSGGLAVLLRWLAAARRRQVALCFLNLPPALRRLAELTNLDALLQICPDAP